MSAPAPPLLANSVLDFLRRHVPFAQMDQAHLRMMAAHARLGYFPAGTHLAGPADGPPDRFYVILRGAVDIGDPAAAREHQTELQLHPGDCFPLGALIENSAVVYEHVAVADTFCYEFERPVFEALLKDSAPFGRFCTQRLAHLLQESRRQIRARAGEDAHARQNMSSLLGALVRRTPVTCTATAPLLEALSLMRGNKVGAIIAVDADGGVCGVFTERDLLDRVVLSGISLDTPLLQVMTSAPLCLDENASAFEAVLLMARHGIRHVPVTRGGRLAGMVSEHDLFSLQRVGLRDIHRAIAEACSTEVLETAAADVRRLARNLLAQGMAVEQLTQLIVALNDQLVARAIGLALQDGALDGIDFCWIALGSEGRQEQTISTDQDNAIVFAATDEAATEGLRARLLPVAAQINQVLARLGFPLCQGGIMAGNAHCCLSLAEWQTRFGNWLRNPSPQALLNAAIFFDFRPLHGNTGLAHSLRIWLEAEARSHPGFLHLLAANAVASAPPLGFFGDLSASARVDLKAQGARPFIDAARVLALAHGIGATHTAQRLRLAALHYGAASEAEAMVEAFHFIQMLRLTRQIQSLEDGGPPNQIEVAHLNELEQRILKEALRQARKLQTRLRLDYAL